MTQRAEMWPMLLHLSLCVVTVTASKFSHVIIEQPEIVNSCGRNEQLLSELMTANSQLQETVSQMQKQLAKLTAGCAHKNTAGELKNIETLAQALRELMSASLIRSWTKCRRANVAGPGDKLSPTLAKFFCPRHNNRRRQLLPVTWTSHKSTICSLCK